MKHKEYLYIALPLVLSTMTQPLLGAIDTAVVGRLGSSDYIGGVAIGAVIFNTLYWLFGFLRVSTSGFTAQAVGSSSEKDLQMAYFRPLIMALSIGLLMILIKPFILNGINAIYYAQKGVLGYAVDYFNILIWGAPLVLVGYVNLGWMMGKKNIKETLLLQISSNVLNILLDLIFVIVLKKGVQGVALATLIAQGYGFIFGSFIVYKQISKGFRFEYIGQSIEIASLKKALLVNADLMIRTVCLLVMTNVFMRKSTLMGPDILATNAVLFQIQYIISYIFDGFSNASSIYAGQFTGEKNQEGIKVITKLSNFYSIVVSVLLGTVIYVLGTEIFKLFTDMKEVVELCNNYKYWLVIFPISIAHGMVYYGIYTGASRTKIIRNSMIVALVVFLISSQLLMPCWGNNGLWFAFVAFSGVRSLFLIKDNKELIQSIGAEAISY